MAYRASIIKSIQRGTITLPSGGAGSTDTATATITAVDVANSVVNWVGVQGSGTTYSNYVRLRLTNSTTVTASHFRDQTTVVSFEVLEFVPNVIASIQENTITLASVTTNTGTITSVDLAKSRLFYSGLEVTVDGGGGAPAVPAYSATGVLTNATTVTVTRNNASGTIVFGYSVVSFR